MMLVSGILTVDPAHADRALDHIRAVTTASRAEDGCLTYEFWVDPGTPGRFRVFEEWESAAALQEHLASEHLAVFRADMADLGLRRGAVTRYEVAGSSRV